MTQEMHTPEEQVAQTPPSAGENWEARYKGIVKKVEELTLANRSVNEQLAAKNSELEQLRGQLTVKDAEKAATVGERDKLLQSITQEKVGLEAKLAELQGLALKVEVIRELGRPELLKISDKLPAFTDKEALKTVLQDMAGFADEQVQKRERDLLSGVIPGVSIAGNQKSGVPGSEAEWERHINSLGLGTRERQQAYDDYYVWLEQKNSPKP